MTFILNQLGEELINVNSIVSVYCSDNFGPTLHDALHYKVLAKIDNNNTVLIAKYDNKMLRDLVFDRLCSMLMAGATGVDIKSIELSAKKLIE